MADLNVCWQNAGLGVILGGKHALEVHRVGFAYSDTPTRIITIQLISRINVNCKYIVLFLCVGVRVKIFLFSTGPRLQKNLET